MISSHTVLHYSTVAKLQNVAKLRNMTFAWFMSSVLGKNGAKVPNYFTLCLILVCHGVPHVVKEIGMGDIRIIFGFQRMEHSKVRLLAGSRKTTFLCSIE
jgi:hypothetical protein